MNWTPLKREALGLVRMHVDQGTFGVAIVLLIKLCG